MKTPRLKWVSAPSSVFLAEGFKERATENRHNINQIKKIWDYILQILINLNPKLKKILHNHIIPCMNM